MERKHPRFETRASGAALKIARTVIRTAGREKPADAVLRTELRQARGVSRQTARAAAEAVFAFYRWKGWLNGAPSVDEQVKTALRCSREYAAQPRVFPDAELLKRAVPEWVADYMEISIDWVRSLQEEPVLWLRARTGQGPALAAQLGHCTAAGQGILSDALRYDGSEDLFRTPQFHAGMFEVQDLASQVVGWICDARPKQTWWDVCAGEGGKTLHLSDCMANTGLIWATDRAGFRLEKLRRRAARAKVFNYRWAVWDGRGALPTKTRFDGVLVDAPCSGIGTWQRNPQARWTTTPRDVEELSAVQQQLLARVAHAVRPGGKLVYSVCTLTRKETIEVASAFGREFPDFEPMAVLNLLEAAASAATQHWLWPQKHKANGMFVAAWRRK